MQQARRWNRQRQLMSVGRFLYFLDRVHVCAHVTYVRVVWVHITNLLEKVARHISVSLNMLTILVRPSNILGFEVDPARPVPRAAREQPSTYEF